MPYLANDRLDDAWSHGDLLITLASDRPDALLHALRQLMRGTRRWLSLHWVVDGCSRPDAPGSATGRTQNRNLLGFKDGSSNLAVGDDDGMTEFVWGGDGDDQPWAVGGTYQAVRLIRLRVERWDRAALGEQEAIIGRSKVSGAPLGLRREEADPAYDDDPSGQRIPVDAHVRLARPRNTSTDGQRIRRKGFNFQKGFDRAGILDQGLAFVSYQRRLADFLASRWRSTRCPSAAATSSCCPEPRTPTTGWDARCWTPDLTRPVRKEPPSRVTGNLHRISGAARGNSPVQLAILREPDGRVAGSVSAAAPDIRSSFPAVDREPSSSRQGLGSRRHAMADGHTMDPEVRTQSSSPPPRCIGCTELICSCAVIQRELITRCAA
jgi:Dyp-type peroxidase family